MFNWVSSVWTFCKIWGEKLWKFFVGGVIVSVAFTSNFIDLKYSQIAVEITGIEQITSAAIDVSASPEFVNLRKLLSDKLSMDL